MDRLRELLLAAEQKNRGLESGVVVVASELSDGNGRFERYWHAPKGGLWMAMIWSDSLLPDYIRFLPFAAGIACCETIRAYGLEASIKWVNDIQIDGRKIAGILTKTIKSPIFGDLYHLLGIGINVNNNTFPEEFKDTAGSMRWYTKTSVDLEDITIKLLAKLCWNIGLLHLHEEYCLSESDDIANYTNRFSIMNSWYKMTDTIGRKVLYGFDVQRNPLYQAMVLDVNTEGGLIMKLDSGDIITEYSGEIVYL